MRHREEDTLNKQGKILKLEYVFIKPVASRPMARTQYAPLWSDSRTVLVLFGSMLVGALVVLSLIALLRTSPAAPTVSVALPAKDATTASHENIPSEARASVALDSLYALDLRGDPFTRGIVSIDGNEIPIQAAYARLRSNGTQLYIGFFREELSDTLRTRLRNASFFGGSDKKVGIFPVLTFVSELSRYGSDCSPFGIKKYRWDLRDPTRTGITKIVRSTQTQDLAEFKTFNCEKRSGGIFSMHSEGASRVWHSAPLTPKSHSKKTTAARNATMSDVWWQIETRLILN